MFVVLPNIPPAWNVEIMVNKIKLFNILFTIRLGSSRNSNVILVRIFVGPRPGLRREEGEDSL